MRRVDGQERQCEACGTTFRRPPSNGGKFCSRACWYANKPTTPLGDRLWAKVDRSGGPEACWPWTGATTHFGHGNIRHGSATLITSRVVWELTHGPIPEDQYVLHSCDNPPCCNPAHLFLGTKKDNSEDMVQKDRSMAGEAHPQVKLTDADVAFIREAYRARSMSGREMARRFGVTEGTISLIARGKRRA